jgi:hypothetical protein
VRDARWLRNPTETLTFDCRALRHPTCGADGIRVPDLLHAMHSVWSETVALGPVLAAQAAASVWARHLTTTLEVSGEGWPKSPRLRCLGNEANSRAVKLPPAY